MTSFLRTFALVACATVFSIAAVKAQSLADFGEKYVDTIVASGQFPANGQDLTVYTVPKKRLFRMTDLIVTNLTGQACDYRVFVGASQTGEFTAQPRSTLPLNFSTGLLFVGPTSVTIRNTPRFGGPTGCGLVTITGVLTRQLKAKKSSAVEAAEEADEE